jgi:hypothetical protein
MKKDSKPLLPDVRIGHVQMKAVDLDRRLQQAEAIFFDPKEL